MTKLLEQAIETVRALSDADQDAAADALFAHLAGGHRQVVLTSSQIEDVKRIQRELAEGRVQRASDEEMATLWRKCGL
jgi:hypothetical protein